MPRLTWDRYDYREVETAREAFGLYSQRHFLARHNGEVVKNFDDVKFTGVLDFEPLPNAYDRVMKEEDPWES